MALKIKVCGMRDRQNIRALATLGPDYMGFIFYEVSKRFVGGLDPAVLADVPAGIKKTGVFADASSNAVLETMARYHLDAVQLHGSEDPVYCTGLRKHTEVIKAFGVDEAFDFKQTEAYRDAAQYFLFDTKTVLKGGSGRRFDWKKLAGYTGATPYFLSGGIAAEHVPDIRAIDDPRLYAVDLNSCFETAPGLKDINKLSIVFNLLKTATLPHQ